MVVQREKLELEAVNDIQRYVLGFLVCFQHLKENMQLSDGDFRRRIADELDGITDIDYIIREEYCRAYARVSKVELRVTHPRILEIINEFQCYSPGGNGGDGTPVENEQHLLDALRLLVQEWNRADDNRDSLSSPPSTDEQPKPPRDGSPIPLFRDRSRKK